MSIVSLQLFQQLDAADFGVSTLHNLTADVINLMAELESNLPNGTQDCCNYNHQILDQYCATRTPVRALKNQLYCTFNLTIFFPFQAELTAQCMNNPNWGYTHCINDFLNCLR